MSKLFIEVEDKMYECVFYSSQELQNKEKNCRFYCELYKKCPEIFVNKKNLSEFCLEIPGFWRAINRGNNENR